MLGIKCSADLHSIYASLSLGFACLVGGDKKLSNVFHIEASSASIVSDTHETAMSVNTAREEKKNIRPTASKAPSFHHFLAVLVQNTVWELHENESTARVAAYSCPE